MPDKKFCPKCGSDDIQQQAGGVTGTWICKKCGYSGTIFPEKTLLSEIQNKKEHKK